MNLKSIRKTLGLLVVIFMLVFVGCSKTDTDSNKEQTGSNNSSTDETADKNQEATDSIDKDVLDGDLSVIIDKIYEKKDTTLMLASTPLDLTNVDSIVYNTGLDDISKVKEAIVSEAMISSQAYSLVLVRVNDPAYTEEVANNMKNGINQSKWICVTADDLQIATQDDLILLIMVSSELKDSVTSQQIIEAFQSVVGAEADLILTK
jgi:hypothetical protein